MIQQRAYRQSSQKEKGLAKGVNGRIIQNMRTKVNKSMTRRPIMGGKLQAGGKHIQGRASEGAEGEIIITGRAQETMRGNLSRET